MGRFTPAVAVILWAVPISMPVNRIFSQPYMDEIFHIPQAQQYCQDNFRYWDSMITTPPDLNKAETGPVTGQRSIKTYKACLPPPLTGPQLGSDCSTQASIHKKQSLNPLAPNSIRRRRSRLPAPLLAVRTQSKGFPCGLPTIRHLPDNGRASLVYSLPYPTIPDRFPCPCPINKTDLSYPRFATSLFLPFSLSSRFCDI